MVVKYSNIMIGAEVYVGGALHPGQWSMVRIGERPFNKARWQDRERQNPHTAKTQNEHQWRSQVFQSGVHEIRDLLGAFHTYALVWQEIRGPLPSSRKCIWDWRICNFPLSRGAYLYFQSLFRRYSITLSIPALPHPSTHPISMQIWTNYETHIFRKLGYVPQTPVVSSVARTPETEHANVGVSCLSH